MHKPPTGPVTVPLLCIMLHPDAVVPMALHWFWFWVLFAAVHEPAVNVLEIEQLNEGDPAPPYAEHVELEPCTVLHEFPAPAVMTEQTPDPVNPVTL